MEFPFFFNYLKDVCHCNYFKNIEDKYLNFLQGHLGNTLKISVPESYLRLHKKLLAKIGAGPWWYNTAVLRGL